MAGGSSDLKFIVEALYKGQGMKQARQELSGLTSMSSKTAKGFEGLAAASMRAQAGMSLQAQRAEALAQRHDELMGAVKKTGVAFGVLAAAGTALLTSSTMLAARVETLGIVVETVGATAGYSAAEMDKFEASIKKQGITTQAARQSLARMAQAQIDFAHGADLARIAQDTAVIASLNSSDAFEQLTYVIQTANIRMGRTLGLNLDFMGSYDRMAQTLGVTTDALTEEQKTQARVNEVMRAGATITGTYEAAMGTAGKQVLSFKRYTEEIQLTLGEAFLPVLNTVVGTATKLAKGFLDMNEHSQRTIALALGLGTALTAAVAGVAGLTVAVNALGTSLHISTGGLTLLLGALAAVSVYAVADMMATEQLRKEYEKKKEAILDNVSTYGEYLVALKELDKEYDNVHKGVKKVKEVYLEIDPITGVMVEKTRELAVAESDLSAEEFARLYGLRELARIMREYAEVHERVRHGSDEYDLSAAVEAKRLQDVEERTKAAREETAEWVKALNEAHFALVDTNAALKVSTDEYGRAGISIGSVSTNVEALRQSTIAYLDWLLTGTPQIISLLESIGQAAAGMSNFYISAIRNMVAQGNNDMASMLLKLGEMDAQIRATWGAFGELSGQDLFGYTWKPEGSPVTAGQYIPQNVQKYGVQEDEFAAGGRLSGAGLSGARLGGSAVAKVGEEGWEYVINGVVVPHDTSVTLERLGLTAGRALRVGGDLEYDDGGANTMPDYHYTSPWVRPPTPPPAAQAAEQAVVASVTGAVEEAATVAESAMEASQVVGLAATSLGAAADRASVEQAAADRRQLEALERGNRALTERLDAILAVLSSQGGAEQVGNAVSRAMQFYDAE